MNMNRRSFLSFLSVAALAAAASRVLGKSDDDRFAELIRAGNPIDGGTYVLHRKHVVKNAYIEGATITAGELVFENGNYVYGCTFNFRRDGELLFNGTGNRITNCVFIGAGAQS